MKSQVLPDELDGVDGRLLTQRGIARANLEKVFVAFPEPRLSSPTARRRFLSTCGIPAAHATSHKMVSLRSEPLGQRDQVGQTERTPTTMPYPAQFNLTSDLSSRANYLL